MAAKNDILNSLRNWPKAFFTAVQVAPLLECDANSIRVMARKKPELLGFPVVVIGTRVKIPKKPFLQMFDEMEAAEDGKPA